MTESSAETKLKLGGNVRKVKRLTPVIPIRKSRWQEMVDRFAKWAEYASTGILLEILTKWMPGFAALLPAGNK